MGIMAQQQGSSIPSSRLNTLKVICEGGLNNNRNVPDLIPGQATELRNFEPSIFGGYRRVNGFSKYSTTAVTGTGSVLGVKIIGGSVVACRGIEVYVGTGTTWAKISSTSRTGAIKYRWDTHYWAGTETIIGVDEVNPAFSYDGSTYTLLNATGSPSNPKYIAVHKSRLFLAGQSAHKGSLVFTAPNDAADYSALNGAGEIVVGDEITGLIPYRNELIIFCKNSIHILKGDSLFDFTIQPITSKFGCLVPDSIQEVSGDLVFMAADGLHVFASTDRINDAELGSISQSIHPTMLDVLSTSTRGNVSSVKVEGKRQYRLFYPTTAQTEASSLGVVGAFNVQRNPAFGSATKGDNTGYDWGELKGIKPFCCTSDYIDDTEFVLHGGYDGFVWRQEQGNDFGGADIDAVFKTAPMDFGDGNVRKMLQKLTIYYKTEGTIATSVFVRYNYDDTTILQPPSFTLSITGSPAIYGATDFIYGTSTYDTTDTPASRNNIVGSGLTAAFHFSSDDAKSSYTIQGFDIEYGIGGRK